MMESLTLKSMDKPKRKFCQVSVLDNLRFYIPVQGQLQSKLKKLVTCGS